MRYILPALLLGVLVLGGCKASGWVWNKGTTPTQVASEHKEEVEEPTEVETEPADDPKDDRLVIYVLGIDGMD
jgi:hypothetical protein